MAYHLPAWIARAFRRDDDGTRWSFEVDRLQAPVAWRWERVGRGGTPERSDAAFPSFAECARDAAAHGFSPSQGYSLREQSAAAHRGWAGPRGAAAEDNPARH